VTERPSKSATARSTGTFTSDATLPPLSVRMANVSSRRCSSWVRRPTMAAMTKRCRAAVASVPSDDEYSTRQWNGTTFPFAFPGAKDTERTGTPSRVRSDRIAVPNSSGRRAVVSVSAATFDRAPSAS